MTLKIAIAGAAGRMGRTLIEAVLAAPDLALAAALDAPGTVAIGRDAGELVGARSTGVAVTDDFRAGIAAADALVDFTRPQGTLAHLDASLAAGRAIVIGTTGFSAAEKTRIAAAAKRIPILFAPNMAVGVNVVFKLAEVAARALGDEYDVEIIEAHHRHKVDAPSGTALRLGEIVAGALGRDLARTAVHGREGDTGERDPKAIGFHAVRGGDIVGEHTVMFAGTGERVEVTVRSGSRLTYAIGALRGARFLADKPHGLFDMQDVLGLR
ncbi:MAG: 4-hydroxy-tetrahydrodipicolinate reductase [Burkholderiales bacterium]|jgi:4-hydroxy-tetrahydrodipicolinate reductase|nr:4-hydroxy-tetrahydrodipicolinate reductase [Burkholderiales bacterium]